MRRFLFGMLLMQCITTIVHGQNVGVGTQTPHLSAKLDVTSDSTGILVPRLTAAQRDSIDDPATGLLVFVTSDSSFYYFNGSIWTLVGDRAASLEDNDRDTKVLVEEHPDDDIIRFSARDSQIMIIDSTGHIGIGDTMPSEALTMRGGSFLQTPGSPSITSTIMAGSTALDLFVSGDYAYLIDSQLDQLKIYDISYPDSLSQVFPIGILSLGPAPTSLFVAGGYLYVTDTQSDSLLIVDVSDPSVSTIVGGVDLSTYSGSGVCPGEVYVSGRYAYILDGCQNSFMVVDVSDPFAPLWVGLAGFGSASGARSLHVAGRFAYVVTNNPGDLTVVDIKDPTNPYISNSLSLEDVSYLQSVYVSGRFAYTVGRASTAFPDDTYLKVIDLGYSGDMSLVSTLNIGNGSMSDVFVSGRYAYALDYYSNQLIIVDVRNPGQPKLMDTITTDENPQALYVSGRHAFVLTGLGTLQSIDISGADITSVQANSLATGNIDVRNDATVQGDIRIRGALNVGTAGIYSAGDIGLSGSLQQAGGRLRPIDTELAADGFLPFLVKVSGKYAYVLDSGNDDITVFDVANPRAPEFVGSVSTGADPQHMALTGNYAYLVDAGSDDLKVIDISDPADPAVHSMLTLGGAPSGIAISGRYAYVVDQDTEDLKVIDLSNPDVPSIVDSVLISPGPVAVAVSGVYAYVIDAMHDSLIVINIDSAYAAFRVGGVGIGPDPAALQISGHFAYVVDGSSDDLKIIDVSDPTAPIVVSSLVIGSCPETIHIAGDYAYLGNSCSDILFVVDISDPLNPVITGQLDMGEQVRSLVVVGRYVYVVVSGIPYLKIIDAAGSDLPTLEAHAIEAGQISLRKDMSVGGQLDVRGGMRTGGLLSDGDVGISGNMLISGRGMVSDTDIVLTILSEHSRRPVIMFAEDIGYSGMSIEYDGELTGTDNKMHIRDIDEARQFTFTSGGNLGIGVQDPSAQLHTTGSVRFASLVSGSLATDAMGNVMIGSDARLKHIEGRFTKGLQEILRINPINYRWRASTGLDTVDTYTGFNAQNVRSAIPEAVGQNNDGYLTLSDRPIIAALVNAVQELHAENEDLKTRLAEHATLSEEVAELRRMVIRLQDRGWLPETAVAK